MMSLLVAGRHPELVGGAVAWVPVYDLVDWYDHIARVRPASHYLRYLRASCGGDPTADRGARDECRHRSAATHIAGAREAGVPVYIGDGLADPDVPPHHGARAFNDLAEPGDRLPDDALGALARNELPAPPRGRRDAPHFFRAPDPAVVHSRSSGPVTFVLFDGAHDSVYNPGLEWITQVARGARRRW